MGITAGLPSARARIDERMTCGNDRKHTSCRVRPRRWGEGGSQHASCMFLASVLTLDSGVELRSASIESVDQHTTVGARRASFGASASGWKEVRGRVICDTVETRTQKKHTHDTVDRVRGDRTQSNAVMHVRGETHAHRPWTQARRGSLICWSEEMTAHGYQAELLISNTS